MAIDLNQVSALLGVQQAPRPNVFDLVTGNNQQDVATASLSNLLNGKPASRLTKNQENVLSNLQSFIDEFVPEKDVATLQASLEGLRNLLELGSESKATNLDPIFSLIATNPSITGLLPTGSIFDEVA